MSVSMYKYQIAKVKCTNYKLINLNFNKIRIKFFRRKV